MLETLSLMGAGFVNALSPINIAAMFLSTALGVTIGCLPGLSAAMGVALLLPITFGMPPATGLIVLGGIYCGAIFGGSISAILIHTPGTPASAATAIEGYQLTLKGQAAKALTVACVASFCGGLLSCISLYFFSPALAQLAMQFKSPEYFWLSLFGLTVIAGVSSKSLLKGLISGFMGLLISTIGMDPMEGVERFMFGQSTLYNGVNVTCALIGLFSMSQVLILAESRIVERAKAKAITDKFRLTRPEMKRITPPVLRSWIIGNIVGILPGAGATIACFMGYNEAKRFSKHKEEFGKGSIEGVAGSESANNAVTGGSLIPTLTLGIPGESVTAVLMAALTLFIDKTKLGKAMRAVSEDKDAATLMGISVDRTITLTFAIGSALAAFASMFYGMTYVYIKPTTGAMPGIKAFTAAVFGGIGSIPGAMLGGILLGLIEQMSKTYISTLWADAIVFAVLVVVLVVKPTGLLGKPMQEKV